MAGGKPNRQAVPEEDPMRDFNSPQQKRLDDARAKVEQAIAENQPQHVIDLAKQVYYAALQAA